MAKWWRFNDKWFNLNQIEEIEIVDNIHAGFYTICFDGSEVVSFDTDKEAEKFIQDFIDEHYIQTDKIS